MVSLLYFQVKLINRMTIKCHPAKARDQREALRKIIEDIIREKCDDLGLPFEDIMNHKGSVKDYHLKLEARDAKRNKTIS